MGRAKRSSTPKRGRLTRGRKRQLLRLNILDHGLKAIDHIEPMLHRVRLTGPYRYTDLKEAVGPMHPLEEPIDRMPPYQAWYVKSLGGFDLNAFTCPAECRPKCVLELCLPDKLPKSTEGHISLCAYQQQCLQRLHVSLPDLKPSEVEYAVDIYAFDAIDVRLLFRLFHRYLSVPYARESRLAENQMELGRNLEVNQHFRVGDMKFYERGDDGERVSGERYWHADDVNRLRLEYTARRRYLRDNRLSSLGDLMNDPRFRHVVKKWVRFYRAKESSRHLPHELDRYESIHEEVKAARADYGNRVYQERERAPRMEALWLALRLSTIWFDRAWMGSRVARPHYDHYSVS